MAINHKADKLALLIGSNPLPNYLAAIALQAKEVFLLYTSETEKPKNYLSDVLKAKGIQVTCVRIGDATDPRSIRAAWEGLNCDHLHYSGGTKPMAAHSRMAFKGAETNCSYLDERKGVLRFDDGAWIDLAKVDVKLTIDTVLKLHGIKQETRSISAQGVPTDGDMRAVAKAVLGDPSIAQSLYEHFRPSGKTRSFSQGQKDPLNAFDLGLSLSVQKIPDAAWNEKRYKAFEKFLTGGWLEWWSAELIRDCGEHPLAIDVGLVCSRPETAGGRTFEIDVALVRGHRLYVVSCTTGDKIGTCKSKLFEVAMRSRQMGGDLARCALVCLLSGDDSQGSYVEQLRTDIRSVWEAQNVPQVFGLADLREWAGIGGPPNTENLRKWLSN